MEDKLDGVRIIVNGVATEVFVDPDTPLLYVLRNDVGLPGTRFGCGLNQCGACNVLVDGRATASCDTPLWSVAGHEVTTVDTTSSPVFAGLREAFLHEQAAQCGYCLSGIVVSAAALLEREPDPTDAEVRAALDANLCRCGSHNRIVRAVLRAAAAVGAAASAGAS
jgi:nicotinate dehydrogenase subunit A